MRATRNAKGRLEKLRSIYGGNFNDGGIVIKIARKTDVRSARRFDSMAGSCSIEGEPDIPMNRIKIGRFLNVVRTRYKVTCFSKSQKYRGIVKGEV